MQSDLSEAELREIAKSFLDEPRIPFEIGRGLRGYLDQAVAPRENNHEEISRFLSPAIEEALQAIKRRRLSKAELIRLIRALSPDAKDFRNMEDIKVPEIIHWFFDHAPESAQQKLLESLTSSPLEMDEYLAGIMRRGEKDKDARR